MPWFITSSGRLELQISKRDAISCAHSGDNMQAVQEVMRKPYIKRQLAKISADTLRAELREWGTWNEKELASHEANTIRLVWLACWDIAEQISAKGAA